MRGTTFQSGETTPHARSVIRADMSQYRIFSASSAACVVVRYSGGVPCVERRLFLAHPVYNGGCRPPAGEGRDCGDQPMKTALVVLRCASRRSGTRGVARAEDVHV